MDSGDAVGPSGVTARTCSMLRGMQKRVSDTPVHHRTNGGAHLAPQSRPNGSLRRRTALYWLTRFPPQREKP